MLIGSKADLVEENPSKRQVSSELVDSFCRQHQLEYMETSAKTGQNVRESLDLLLMKIYEMGSRNPGNKPFDTIGVELNKGNGSTRGQEAKKEDGCCS